MNNRRAHACAVWYKNNFYVFGGYDGENALSSVEFYNPNIDRWCLLPDQMTTKRMKFSVSLYGDDVYVIGGMIGSRGPMTDDVEKYSFVNSKWTNVRSLAEKKMEMNCVGATLLNKVISGLGRA